MMTSFHRIAATAMASLALAACSTATGGHHHAKRTRPLDNYTAAQRQFASDMRSQYNFASSVSTGTIVSYGVTVCADRGEGKSQAAVSSDAAGYFTDVSTTGEAMARLAEADLCPKNVPPPTPARVTFIFWGNAPGVNITYGSDTSNLSGPGLPFRAHLAYDSGASYYVATAQLNGSGIVHCKVIVSDGTSTYTKQGVAQGGFNICSAQLNNEESFGSGWQ